MKPTGLVIFAHGSAVESANDAVRAVVAEMSTLGGFELVETAFLEGGKPDLANAVDRLVCRGVGKICVVPYFLTLGTHLKRDLPKLVEECASRHAGLQVTVSPPLDGHPALAQILLERASEAMR